jgi:hypothetical protein
MTYHGSIQEGIVVIWIGLEQLTPQEGGVLDILEQGHVDRVGLVVR